jgi:hypothetical protein
MLAGMKQTPLGGVGSGGVWYVRFEVKLSYMWAIRLASFLFRRTKTGREALVVFSCGTQAPSEYPVTFGRPKQKTKSSNSFATGGTLQYQACVQVQTVAGLHVAPFASSPQGRCAYRPSRKSRSLIDSSAEEVDAPANACVQMCMLVFVRACVCVRVCVLVRVRNSRSRFGGACV